MKGAVHVHSTFSDGELSLAEIRDKFRKVGCCFVALSDHSDAFDPDKLQLYVETCQALSDRALLLIPGLEHETTDGLHVLALGCARIFGLQPAEKLIAEIQRSGGLAVVAHPAERHFALIRRLSSALDAVEVWNTKRDGRYGPRADVVRLAAELCSSHRMRAVYGQDLHFRQQPMRLFTYVRSTTMTAPAILESIRLGDFEGGLGELRLPSDAHIEPVVLDLLSSRQRRAAAIRSVLRGGQRLLQRSGFRLPPTFKTQLRRFF
jgi:predicted metal-dependent phosphoesterase TrpH